MGDGVGGETLTDLWPDTNLGNPAVCVVMLPASCITIENKNMASLFFSYRSSLDISWKIFFKNLFAQI